MISDVSRMPLRFQVRNQQCSLPSSFRRVVSVVIAVSLFVIRWSRELGNLPCSAAGLKQSILVGGLNVPFRSMPICLMLEGLGSVFVES